MLQRRDTFAAVFSVWDAKWTIMDPFAERWDSVNSYRFYLGGYAAYIKVDGRRFPEAFAKAALNPEGPLHLISRALATSKDVGVIANILEANPRLR
jgi:hypothetical protein